MPHQSASVARRGAPRRLRPDAHPGRRLSAAPQPALGTSRSARVGDGVRLAATDLAVVAAVSLAMGSTGAAALIRAVAAVLALASIGLYRPRLTFSALDDLPRLLLGIVVVAPIGTLASVPVAWPAFAVAGVVLGRALAYEALRRRRRRAPGEPAIVIGAGDVAIRLAEALDRDRTYGLAPLGLVGALSLTEPEPLVPLLGPLVDLDEIISRRRPGAVIVTFAGAPDADLVGTLRQCRARGITVFIVPRLFELPLGRAGAELVRGIPLVRMRPEPAHLRRLAGGVKRAMDIVGAVLGLLLLAPVFAACALAVRLESGRAKVIFRQLRIGLHGRQFTILKFRSLTPATETESQIRWSINADARLGPVGKALRASSLDELPQLLNVLRGDMSLVGPRPERPFFVDQFTRAYAGYADRHRMPAGITGWAQIHGLRGDTSISERVRFDNYYVENWSLGLDLKIILRTVGSVLSIPRGA